MMVVMADPDANKNSRHNNSLTTSGQVECWSAGAGQYKLIG
jgi:hypothetical protein